MINIFLFYEIFIIIIQARKLTYTKTCEICIINSQCTDDSINFNISISKYCQAPLETSFTYHTDVNLRLRFINLTTNCNDCYINISLEPVKGVWYYTLKLESPEPSKNCLSQTIARCGGAMSYLIWIITGALSTLFVVLGIILYSITRIRRRKKPSSRLKTNKSKINANVN